MSAGQLVLVEPSVCPVALDHREDSARQERKELRGRKGPRVQRAGMEFRGRWVCRVPPVRRDTQEKMETRERLVHLDRKEPREAKENRDRQERWDCRGQSDSPEPQEVTERRGQGASRGCLGRRATKGLGDSLVYLVPSVYRDYQAPPVRKENREMSEPWDRPDHRDREGHTDQAGATELRDRRELLVLRAAWERRVRRVKLEIPDRREREDARDPKVTSGRRVRLDHQELPAPPGPADHQETMGRRATRAQLVFLVILARRVKPDLRASMEQAERRVRMESLGCRAHQVRLEKRVPQDHQARGDLTEPPGLRVDKEVKVPRASPARRGQQVRRDRWDHRDPQGNRGQRDCEEFRAQWVNKDCLDPLDKTDPLALWDPLVCRD